MKCINKAVCLLLIAALAVMTGGCGEQRKIENAYKTFDTTRQYGMLTEGGLSLPSNGLFAQDLCVTDGSDVGTAAIDPQKGEGAGVFNLDKKETLYAQNVFGKVYPASTTKVLTAYVAFKYGDLEGEITVSEHACDQERMSSVCNLAPGDVLTLRQLLYGLLLRSGNDAAVAIAEGVGGSEEAFMELMNREAGLLGATHSHFVTPNGLHDDDHYTCVYDMYLIFQAAMGYGEFTDIISSSSYEAVYTGVSGEPVQQTWENTNRYLTGEAETPEGFTMIGGKTGTTSMAGYCLIMLAKNAAGDDVVALAYYMGSAEELYEYMTKLFTTFGNG